MMNKYQVGDYVKIVNDGQTYSTYDSFFDEIRAPELKKEFCRTRSKIGWGTNNGDVGQILALGIHQRRDDILYVVLVDDKYGGYLTLIGEKGIQLEYSSCGEIDGIKMDDFLEILGAS